MATDAKTGQPIYSGAPGVGLRNVGSYQISGEPWISGSEGAGALGKHVASTVKRYQFPFVTREVTVVNFTTSQEQNHIYVHFASGSEHTFSSTKETSTYNPLSNVFQGYHYFSLSGSSITFRAKCKEIYVTTDARNEDARYRILADLTNVPTGRMYELTGSGHTEMA